MSKIAFTIGMHKAADAMTRYLSRTGQMAQPRNQMQRHMLGAKIQSARARIAEAVAKRDAGKKVLPSTPGRFAGIQQSIKQRPSAKPAALDMIRKGHL